jgi:tetratricopeptide (TPR) repeat protein
MTARSLERAALEQRLEHVRVDLRELEEQLEVGEVDAATGARLRSAYERELAELERSLSSFDGEDQVGPATTQPRSYRRAIAGTAALIAAFTLAIVFISGDTVPTQQGAAAGVDPTPRAAPQTGSSLDAMEQVVAENPGNLTLRLALADAYFQRSQYSASLGHYLAVLEAEPSAEEESVALGRVGWMAFITSQFDAADEYLRRSVDVDPGNVEGKLFLGYVRFHGFDDATGSIPLLEEVLAFPDLSPDLRIEVERTLESAREMVEAP